MEPPLALPDELNQLISHSGDTILVGGQALGAWATIMQIEVPEELGDGITRDLDFLARADWKSGARNLAETYGKNATLHLASMGEVGPQAAVVVIEQFNGRPPGKAGELEVDFLVYVHGIQTEEVEKKAVKLLIGNHETIIMHPVHCLISRVENFHFPQKRCESGVAQTVLAVAVVRAFLTKEIEHGELKSCFRAVESITRIAASKWGVWAYHEHQVDVLDAIPVDKLEHKEFQKQRWPQILQNVKNARER